MRFRDNKEGRYLMPTDALTLADIAHGRSGDKGNHANIAVLAYTPRDLPG